MIPYVEIIDKYTLKRFDLVEPQESWFELSYYECGEFQVYCRATRKNLTALKKGNYVKIPNKRFIWVITSVQYTFTAGGARMISAKGYEAKYLLKKRCILTPKELQGTITDAVYGLVNHALGTGANAARKIVGFTVDGGQLENPISVDGTQAERGNLKDFVETLLKRYHCGSQVIYDNGKLVYRIFNGKVKPNIKFSQSLDNLIASEYLTDDAEVGTSALVVSTFDETITVDGKEQKRKVDYTQEYDEGKTGIDRSEIVVSSNLSTKYEDANGNEQETTPDSTLYQGWLIEEGRNEIENHKTMEEIKGEIDLVNSKYSFDEDFFIGDIVKAQDEYFNFSVNPRVLKYRMAQDTKKYQEEAEYSTEV